MPVLVLPERVNEEEDIDPPPMEVLPPPVIADPEDAPMHEFPLLDVISVPAFCPIPRLLRPLVIEARALWPIARLPVPVVNQPTRTPPAAMPS